MDVAESGPEGEVVARCGLPGEQGWMLQMAESCQQHMGMR